MASNVEQESLAFSSLLNTNNSASNMLGLHANCTAASDPKFDIFQSNMIQNTVTSPSESEATKLWCAGCYRVTGDISEVMEHAYSNVCGKVPWADRPLNIENITPSSRKREFEFVAIDFDEDGRANKDCCGDKKLKTEADGEPADDSESESEEEDYNTGDSETYDSDDSETRRQKKINRLYRNPNEKCHNCDRRNCNRCGRSDEDELPSDWTNSDGEGYFRIRDTKCVNCDRRNCVDCYDSDGNWR